VLWVASLPIPDWSAHVAIGLPSPTPIVEASKSITKPADAETELTAIAAPAARRSDLNEYVLDFMSWFLFFCLFLVV
jgi:hypothetical protein